MAVLLQIEKTVVEGAGAAGVAAVLAHPELFAGRKVGIVLSGGNIDTRLLANVLLRDLALPDFRNYAVDVPTPGGGSSEATRVLGEFIRDVIVANPSTFRLFGPDETASNRLGAVFEVTDRQFDAEILPTDEHRVIASVLAIAYELSVDGMVLRYRAEETDDGLSG